jgi:hypothetical protein
MGGWEVKHVKEPWEYICPNKDHNFARLFSGSRYIGSVTNSDETRPETIANAKRIVACVNACSGLTNEQLATDEFTGLIRAHSRIAELEARIAELEAALKSLIVLADLGFRIARLECGVPEIKRFEKNFQLAKEILAGDEK